MGTFAFLIHPLDFDDIYKKYKIARHVSPRLVASLLKRRRSFKISDITGIKSATGQEIEGIFIGVPLLPEQFDSLDEDFLVRRVIKACNMAKKLGADIVGLGAHTAMVGDGGRLIAEAVDIPVTTGNTYTVATAIQGTELAARLMEVDMAQSRLAVVGATGSIGRTCVEAMAGKVASTVLVGRDRARLEGVAKDITGRIGVSLDIEDDMRAGLSDADIVITVTGSTKSIIYPESLKAGAIVCDVARPRDVSHEVAKSRDDVLVIEGGLVAVPGSVDFGVNFGCPPGLAMACMAETMLLALERNFDSCTIGKNITIDNVNEMDSLAQKHGFTLAGLRSFEKALLPEDLTRLKDIRASRIGKSIVHG